MGKEFSLSKMQDLILHGYCENYLPRIPDNSIDMILADLPFGVTKNVWDTPIPFEFLWPHYERITTENAAIILFGQEKFSAKAILSNEKLHRYNLIWKKGDRTTGFLNANRQPLRNHEDIIVFYKRQPIYNPQMEIGEPVHSSGRRLKGNLSSNYGEFKDVRKVRGNLKYPRSILTFDKPHPSFHPTQKPVLLCEYLIKTYTNEGALVLDNTMGVGTTCKAAANTGRHYFGMEAGNVPAFLLQDLLCSYGRCIRNSYPYIPSLL